MKRIKHVPIWEVNNRLKTLEQFRSDVSRYFSNSAYSLEAQGMIEKPEAKEARSAINLTLYEARDCIQASGVITVVMYYELPKQGGRSYPVDVIMNLFECYDYNKRPDDITGLIERSIGIHKSEVPKAKIRTLNPIWWVGRLISWVVALPFLLIERAGFDASKAQQSMMGKIFKLLFELVVLVEALVSIVDFLGWKSKLQTLLVTLFQINPG